jgi:hypothetical protein
MEAEIYNLSGLRIASDFPLLGLEVCRNDAKMHCDVVIRRAPTPKGIASVAATYRNAQFTERYNGSEVLLEIQEVGRFLLRAGQEILLDLAPSSDHDEVRAYLLGAVFGALCHQRGITPLHASAIDVADGCVAFVGDSGAGKSTLVAALAQRGHEIITDDVCFLQLDTNGDVQAWPGIGRIRLWEDARAFLGFDGPGVEREVHRYDKYVIPVPPPRNPKQPRRLRRVYQLHRASKGVPEVTRLRGTAAVEVLMQNVYQSGFAERSGHLPLAFVACTAAARDVAVFQFSRPRDFSTLGRDAEMLEKHLSKLC